MRSIPETLARCAAFVSAGDVVEVDEQGRLLPLRAFFDLAGARPIR